MMATLQKAGNETISVLAGSTEIVEGHQNGHGRLTVGAFNWLIPHYRQPLFKLLSEHPSIEFVFCAPKKYHDPTIKIGDFRQLRYKEIRSWQWKIPFMPQYVTLQLHSIGSILNRTYDAVILLNDIVGVDVWICLILARILGRRVILWGQGLSKKPTMARTFLRKLMITLSDATLLYTDGGKDFWVQQGIDPAKLFVAYNTLDTRHIDHVKQSITQRELRDFRNRCQWNDKKIIVVDGRLVPEKRIDIVLHAMKRVVERHSNTHLAIIGDGPMKEEIRQMVEVLDIPHMVTMFGGVYDEREHALIYMNSTAAVLPAFAGLAILHAFSYGVPFILGRGKTDHGPEAELVIHRHNGFVCNLESIDEFADAMCLLLENEELHRTMAENAFRMIHEKYNLDNMAAAIVDAVRYSTKA
jgi:glycosyltransferase involved in cell wall biosynthesis